VKESFGVQDYRVRVNPTAAGAPHSWLLLTGLTLSFLT